MHAWLDRWGFGRGNIFSHIVFEIYCTASFRYFKLYFITIDD